MQVILQRSTSLVTNPTVVHAGPMEPLRLSTIVFLSQQRELSGSCSQLPTLLDAAMVPSTCYTNAMVVKNKDIATGGPNAARPLVLLLCFHIELTLMII